MSGIVICMDPLYLFIFTKIFSTAGFVVVAVLICTFLYLQHNKRKALLFFTTTLFLMILVQTLKTLLHVQRPSDALIQASGYAFPSGHAAGVMFLSVTTIYLARKMPRPLRDTIWIIALTITLLIGMSRLQLRVHTPLQVIVGYVIGALCGGIFIILCKHFEQHSIEKLES